MKLWLLRFRRRNRKWIALFFCMLLFAAAGWLLVAQMQPLIARVAVTRVSNQVNRIISAAVSDAVSRGEVEYERLISFQTDNSGRITAISSNMAEFNRLQCLIDSEILAKLAELDSKSRIFGKGAIIGYCNAIFFRNCKRNAIKIGFKNLRSLHRIQIFSWNGI